MSTKMSISKYETQVYSILRIVVGFLFLWHGSQKLFAFPPEGHVILPLLNGGELAIIYCFLFLFISTRGSGVFSIDHFLEKRSEKQNLQHP
jgi:putative oxidoreductase